MNPFQDPNFLERLNQDPRTKELMKDPEFVKTLEELSTNPKDLGYVVCAMKNSVLLYRTSFNSKVCMTINFHTTGLDWP